MDNEQLKAKEHQSWSAVAQAWRRFDPEIVAWVAPVTDRMIERLSLRQGAHVIDLACGTGEPSLAIAERVGPRGSVLATDFVEEMLAIARDKAARRGATNISFRREDAEQIDLPASSFDAATMRFGLMFLPEPIRAMRRVHGALVPGGRFVVATWRGADANPWAQIPIASLKRRLEIPPPAPGAPGLFAFADRERLASTLGEAGFRDVRVEEVPNEIASLATGASFSELIFGLSGPLASLLGRLPQDARVEVAREIGAQVEEAFARDGRLAIPGAAWVATATK